MKLTKLRSLLLCVGAVLLTSSAAFAGPTWTFGPEDEGLLKLEYKGQFQLDWRDNGACADSDSDTTEFNFRRNRTFKCSMLKSATNLAMRFKYVPVR